MLSTPVIAENQADINDYQSRLQMAKEFCIIYGAMHQNIANPELSSCKVSDQVLLMIFHWKRIFI